MPAFTRTAFDSADARSIVSALKRIYPREKLGAKGPGETRGVSNTPPRLLPTTPADGMVLDDPVTEPACPPTFNVQEEVISFQHKPLACLTARKYTPITGLPWSAIFTMLTTRLSNDVGPFRGGPGAETVHCMITAGTTSLDQRRKLIVAIQTCVPKQDTKVISSRSVDQVYQDLVQQRYSDPPTSIPFSYRDRHGSLIHQTVLYDHLRLGDGLPITPAVMNLACQVTLRYGPSKVLPSPALELNRADAFHWACSNPPPADWRGLRITPLSDDRVWSLIVEEYRGPHADRDIMIFDVLNSPPDVAADSSREQLTQLSGPQLSTLHILYEGLEFTYEQFADTQEPWRTGYRVLDYVFTITRSARLTDFSFPALGDWVAWSENCDLDGIQTTRENIAMAILTVQA
ncbi:hypothetical protein FIBSPDRAFT_899891 [Athelia psychrophila]|uniref:Uncharacterized protein n=1 Tax=Athelia psychrophila TaxID=1759441 RepID=A0A165Z3N4_9AGAM|nr:hypothetical protein FIBSPDRAFT_899891 [Fibularhizoctonia sp. CBS 109695]